jgi:hypothetical protein
MSRLAAHCPPREGVSSSTSIGDSWALAHVRRRKCVLGYLRVKNQLAFPLAIP